MWPRKQQLQRNSINKMKIYIRLGSELSYLVIMLFLCGCSGNGYITSSVGTVLGLDVSENPKTQVPHIRFGYVRNGLYYVPTGKTLTTSNGNVGIAGPANETPTVVSEIFVNSKFLTDITISEKFAIGQGAVNSGSATATFANPAAQAVASSNGGVTTTPTAVLSPPTPTTVVLPPRSQKITISKEQMAAAVKEGIQKADLQKLQHPTIEAFKKWRDSKKTPEDADKDAAEILDSQGADKKYSRSLDGLLDFIKDPSNQDKLKNIKEALEKSTNQ